MEVLIWIGFSVSLFAASVMTAKRNRMFSDRILSIWLFFLAFDFLLRAIELYVYDMALLSNSFLLFNPLFFLYAKSLTNKSFTYKWYQIFHAFPFIFFEIIVHIKGEELTLNAFFLEKVNVVLFYSFLIVSVLSWVYYITKSLIVLRNHTQQVKNEYSIIDKSNNVLWLKIVAGIYITYSIISFLLGIYFFVNKLNSSFLVIFISSMSLALVYLFGYYGLLQDRIFKHNSEVEKPALKIAIKNSEIDLLITKIYDFFKKEKPYLNQDFNMDAFSDQLNVPKHQLTMVLNKFIGKNFFQFVNEFRIEEAKKFLLDKNNVYSIEAIGYDSGFNSKSSFFTIFKKITGMTPLKFKKENLVNV